MSAEDLAAMGVDAATILHVYSWGFGLVLSAWFLGYGLGVAIGLIRKL